MFSAANGSSSADRSDPLLFRNGEFLRNTESSAQSCCATLNVKTRTRGRLPDVRARRKDVRCIERGLGACSTVSPRGVRTGENRRSALTSPACRFTLLCNYFDLQRQTGFTLQKRAHFCLRRKMAVSIRTPPAGQIPFQPTSASGFISLVFISEEFKEAGEEEGSWKETCRRLEKMWTSLASKPANMWLDLMCLEALQT